jgi:hypothetical protein
MIYLFFNKKTTIELNFVVVFYILTESETENYQGIGL